MSLDNKRNENPQWYLQLEQERQKLSASIVEALADTRVQDDAWDEEDEQMEARVETADETTVIPPRLSLQSKVLPAVHMRDVEGTAQAMTPSSTTNRTELPATDDGHKDSVFVRLARRLTSSFSTFGVSIQSEVEDIPTQSMGPARSQPAQTVQSEYLPMARSGVVPPERVTNPPLPRPGQASHVVDTSFSTSMRSLPAPGGTSSPESKRRLARTTRVRLETAPAVKSPTTTARTAVVQPAETDHIASNPVPVAHQLEETTKDAWLDTGANAVLPSNTYEESRETSVKIPAIAMLSRSEHNSVVPTSQRQFFGNGMFTSGQGDKMIEDSNVTEKCIVLVMLTGNPGPVVVHYISLYPGTGFTVHLTAPADKEAGFNYVIFSSEQS